LKQSSKAQILRKSPIFSSLNDDELTELAGLAIERSFMPNEFIFWDGDAPEWFYIVTEGKVKVLKHSSLGREFTIAFFGPGEMFGEVAVFENKPYPASAQTVAETKVLGIKREDLLYFLANRPQVALKIINILAARLRDAQNRLRDLAGERVEQRLAGTLVMLCSKLGPNLPFTQQPEFLHIEDNHFTTNGTNNSSVFQVAHRPDYCLGSGPHHLGDFLSGKGKTRAKF